MISSNLLLPLEIFFIILKRCIRIFLYLMQVYSEGHMLYLALVSFRVPKISILDIYIQQ